MARLDLPSDAPSRASPGSRYFPFEVVHTCTPRTSRSKQKDQKFVVVLSVDT